MNQGVTCARREAVAASLSDRPHKRRCNLCPKGSWTLLFSIRSGRAASPVPPPTPPCRSAQKPKRENSADLGCVDCPGFFSMAPCLSLVYLATSRNVERRPSRSPATRRGASPRTFAKLPQGAAAEATGLYRPHFRYDLNSRHFAGLRSLTSWARERNRSRGRALRARWCLRLMGSR
jgi:hypothetical protein